MKENFDGRGEGFGKYQGLSVAETQALFDKCIEEPSMRSISAVLRITREQLEARGQLGTYPTFAWIAGLLCAISLTAKWMVPAKLQEIATKIAIGSGCVLVLLLVATVPTYKTRRRNLEQEVAIREAAVRAVSEILASGPTLKPLTMEQEFTVKLLIKKSASGESLRTLL